MGHRGRTFGAILYSAVQHGMISRCGARLGPKAGAGKMTVFDQKRIFRRAMQHQLFYCKSWFAAKRIPIEIWTAEQAEAAHAAGKTYAVLVGSSAKPSHVLDVASDWVGVDFLDEHLREALTYHFRKWPAEGFLSRWPSTANFGINPTKWFAGQGTCSPKME